MTAQQQQNIFQRLIHSPLQTIHHWQRFRLTWAIMLGTALFLEVCAISFQYIMALDPCEKCVYQRLAVFLLMAAAMVIMIKPSNIVLRLVGYITWFYAAGYGLSVAITQMGDYEGFNPFASSCGLIPTFPLAIPLHQWLPSIFQPQALCGSDNWQFLDMNMAQWMTSIFSIYLLAAAVCVISSAWYIVSARKA